MQDDAWADWKGVEIGIPIGLGGVDVVGVLRDDDSCQLHSPAECVEGGSGSCQFVRLNVAHCRQWNHRIHLVQATKKRAVWQPNDWHTHSLTHTPIHTYIEHANSPGIHVTPSGAWPVSAFSRLNETSNWTAYLTLCVCVQWVCVCVWLLNVILKSTLNTFDTRTASFGLPLVCQLVWLPFWLRVRVRVRVYSLSLSPCCLSPIVIMVMLCTIWYDSSVPLPLPHTHTPTPFPPLPFALLWFAPLCWLILLVWHVASGSRRRESKRIGRACHRGGYGYGIGNVSECILNAVRQRVPRWKLTLNGDESHEGS